MWTRDSLSELVKEKFSEYLFIVVSNREPYTNTFSGQEIILQVPASGLTVALDPVMQACGGTWIAHGSGDADWDTVDADNKLSVPPDAPSYSLKRVRLTKFQEEGYYYGFSNGALWPLSHIVYTKPVFDKKQWDIYKKVNEIFAQNILNEVGGKKAFIFIQDYHLALLSRLIKNGNPNIISAQFWHIPWPNKEAFRICPWQEEILDGLLGNDLLGFHIRYHCDNFLDTVASTVESKVDWERYEITRSGRKTLVLPFPISVDFERLSAETQEEAVDKEISRLKDVLGIRDEKIGIGLDRIDYTKGIPERFYAIDRFFEKYPQYLGKAVFVQAGVLSRAHIETYKTLNEEIDNIVEEINWKHTTGRWKPIIWMRELCPPITLAALRRMADFCVVSSLHDGMNLVAKEYIASRYDEDGVLILSPFTGAARELTDSLLVNPYAVDDFADSIKAALEMSKEERQKRMRKMREIVKENNIYKWAADIISALAGFEFGG
jgi:trehalose-6-phosphate synthase